MDLLVKSPQYRYPLPNQSTTHMHMHFCWFFKLLP
ncbi:unnamed protein product [Rhodiola kirilowii]